jgi:hypothetical protein
MRETELKLEELISYLDRRGAQWTHSAELARAFDVHKRLICRMADEADGRIISSVNGYKLQDHATRIEVMQAYSHLTNLIIALQARANALMSRHHQATKKADANNNQPTLF